MNYKRIIAAHHGSGTIFELEDGVYALVDHEVSEEFAKYSVYANAFLRHGYFFELHELPEGNCDADIRVLTALPKPDNAYGFGEERLRQMLEHREKVRAELELPPEAIM